MLFSFALMVGSLVAAAPTIVTETNEAAEALAVAPLHLEFDDIVLYGFNGTFKVIKEAEYLALIESGDILLGEDAEIERQAEGGPSIQARQSCNNRNVEFTVTRTLDFSDWDVQMSPVVGALQAPVTIGISRGNQISNSVAISATAGISISVFSAQFGIEFSRTWTSIDTTLITYTVPTGLYGTVVHNPLAHRIIGDAYTSCGTGPWTRSPFQATSYSSQNLGAMNWVRGSYRLCTSRSNQIPFCLGSGTHT